MCVCMCVREYVCVYARVCACVCVCVRACMCVCVRLYVFVCACVSYKLWMCVDVYVCNGVWMWEEWLVEEWPY